MVFVRQFWWKRPYRTLLKFSKLSEEFISHGPMQEILRGIHHCLPRQLFVLVGDERRLLSSWQSLRRTPLSSMTASERLCVQYWTSRLGAGVVLSLPDGMTAGAVITRGGDGSGPGGEVVPHENARGCQVSEALACIDSQSVADHSVTLSAAHKRHTFLRVVNSKLDKRQLLYEDPHRNHRIAAVKLRLVGGASGGEGVFDVAEHGGGGCCSWTSCG